MNKPLRQVHCPLCFQYFIGIITNIITYYYISRDIWKLNTICSSKITYILIMWCLNDQLLYPKLRLLQLRSHRDQGPTEWAESRNPFTEKNIPFVKMYTKTRKQTRCHITRWKYPPLAETHACTFSSCAVCPSEDLLQWCLECTADQFVPVLTVRTHCFCTRSLSQPLPPPPKLEILCSQIRRSRGHNFQEKKPAIAKEFAHR